MDRLVATPAEVAEALQCSIDVVRDLKQSGRLPHVQLTKAMWAVPITMLAEWLEDEARASTVRAELEADGVAVDIPNRKGGHDDLLVLRQGNRSAH